MSQQNIFHLLSSEFDKEEKSSFFIEGISSFQYGKELELEDCLTSFLMYLILLLTGLRSLNIIWNVD